MTQQDYRRCGWCGGEFAVPGKVGRPPQFCKRSHRQRAYEARQAAARLGLPADAVVISLSELEAWRDRLYVLETALEDVQADLAGSPRLQDYADAYVHLLQAALGLKGFRIQPSALSG